MDNVKSSIIEILSMLDEKMKLFNNIMEITLKQKNDIEKNEANRIQKLVNQKQSVIDRIDEIDKSFSQRFDLLKKHLKVTTLEEADFSKHPELKDLKLKVTDIIEKSQEIILIEESNREKLKGIMNGLQKEIKQINTGKKSIKAYEKPIINNEGIYIDKMK